MHGALTVFVAVAVEGFLLIAHTEEWRLENVEVACTNDLGKELQEIRHDEQTDVHAVHIGISR